MISASDEEITAAIADGTIKSDPGLSSGTSALSACSVSDKAVKTLAGETQYDTAAAEALAAYPSGCSTAVVASGESYVDALSATGLAGALDCPILLTGRDSLPDATADALSRLGVTRVVVVGGKAVVGTGVYKQLSDLGSAERLWGEDQFDTQLAVYSYGAERGLWGATAVVASGSDIAGRFADALSASPVAFKLKAPVFLVDDAGNLPDKTASVLLDSGISRAIVAGGNVVVSEYTEGFMQAVTVRASGASDVVRCWGETGYDTSAELAKWAVGQGILTWENAAVSTDIAPYDALAGSVLQGKRGAVLLLADQDADGNFSLLAENGVHRMTYFGGKALFNNVFKLQKAYEMGISLGEVEGMLIYLDAGHGWNSSNNNVMDWGASGCGYAEFNLTSELANKVADVLRNNYGMDVYVNDDGGYYAYRNAEAYRMNAGALVSIHFNSTGSGTGSGIESYIHSYNSCYGSETLQSHAHAGLVGALGLHDRGMKQAELAVCGGKCPGVLLEIAFIDNQGDMDAYQSRKDAVAAGIAAGVAQ
ncbi:cell wall-binding repeat-containing protein [Senegalimassilia anaerobia]|uniref:cell wall-binding repeat-containing protein n=1 Tax=Senegalimassilia anaerobia TaxID=1473216 RepID=UPI0026EA927E|nr:cell wall-binding repeat-containing protein [Senegalimassilia anaerobia]